MKSTWKAVCILLLVVSLCSPALAESKKRAANSPGKPISKLELGKYQYCGADTDCVAAQNGCCDCANGGADVAINKMHLEQFKAHFACDNVVCTARAKIPPCGSGVVSCVNHECRYIQAADATMVPPVEVLPPAEGDVE